MIRVEEVQKNYKGLVIGNQGKNYSAGANLVYVGGLAADKKWNDLTAMVDKFQQANLALKYCKKTGCFGSLWDDAWWRSRDCHAFS